RDAGGPVAGHVHRAPVAVGGPRRRPGAGGGRPARGSAPDPPPGPPPGGGRPLTLRPVPAGGPPRAGLLRPDLYLDRAARPCPYGAAPHPGPAGTGPRHGRPAGRPGAELRGGPADGRPRTPPRRPPGRPARRPGPHLRGDASGVRPGLGPAGPGPPRHRPDPLPPARGPRRRARPPPAGRGRPHRRTVRRL